MNGLKEFGYWLFSSLAQSSAALFGVLGMFVVFRMQYLRERLKSTITMAADIIRKVEKQGDAGYLMNRDEIKDFFEEIIKQINQVGESATSDLINKKNKYQAYIDTINAYEQSEEQIVAAAKKVFVSTGFLFVVSLGCLFLNPFLTKFWLILVSCILIVIISMNIILIWKFISFALHFQERSEIVKDIVGS